MNNMLFKRFLSVAVAVVMVMSMVVMPVAADEVSSEGTTCTEHAYVDGTCECGATKPVCDHANTNESVTPATYIADGVKTFICGDCGETVSTETIPAPGHSYDENGKCGCGAEKPAEATPVDETPQECTCEVQCNEQKEDCAVCAADPGKCTGKTAEDIDAAQKAAAEAARVKEVDDLIAALPETVTAENYESVMAQLTAIMACQESMGELWSQVNQEKLNAVIAATQNPAPTPEDPSASATIVHGLQTIVDKGKPRESVTTTLENVHAKNELKVELYSAGTLLSTTTLRQADLDDATAKYPANGEYTVNIVLSGQASGSWDTTWHVIPNASNIPDTIKVYADGELMDTKSNEDGYFLTEDEKNEYIDLVTSSGEIKYGIAVIRNTESRENFQVDAYAVDAKMSLAVKLYSEDGKELVTSTLKAVSDDGRVHYPANGTWTANIVVSGEASGSWDTIWHQVPNEYNVPAKIELWADGVCVNTYEPALSDEMKTEYLALDGVKKSSADLDWAYIGDTETRENIQVEIYDVFANESLVLKLYSDETLLATSAMKNADDENPDVPYFPVNSKAITANVVVSGKEAGSWNTTWHEAPTLNNVPTKIEAWVDGEWVDTLDPALSVGETAKYLALDGVWKAATVTNASGVVTHHATVDDALTALANGGVAEVFVNMALTESHTIEGDATIDLNGCKITGGYSVDGTSKLELIGLKDSVILPSGGTVKFENAKATVTATEFATGYGYSNPVQVVVEGRKYTYFLDIAGTDKGCINIDGNGAISRSGDAHLIAGHVDRLPENAYTITEVNNGSIVTQTHIYGSASNLIFKCNGFYETFVPTYIEITRPNGTVDRLTTDLFSHKEGSTIVTLKNAYLRRLPVADGYKITLTYKDGLKATGTFNVRTNYIADTTNPKTGDPIFLALSVMLLTGCALAVIPFTLKKKIR